MSNKQLEKIYKKEKRGKYVFWGWAIVLGFVGIGLAYLQQYWISAVMEGLTCLCLYLIYRQRDLEGNICQIAQVNPTRKNVDTGKEEEKPERIEIAPTILPIEEYLSEKPNPHVLLTGISGIGKTTTMVLVVAKNRKKKVIFNFKTGDKYLSSGWRVLDVSKNPPDPYGDISAYSSAFATAYHIVPDKQGYMAKQVQSTLNESLKHSKSFAEQIVFLENKAKNRGSGDIAESVLTQVRPLVVSIEKKLTALDLSQDLVLDFSGFEFDEGKVFYAELVLNMIWNILKRERHEIVVVIDEAHHLLRVPTTKINEFLKEGRSLGVAVYCATQGYTDIDSGLRSNFATKFIFKTDDGEALSQLRQIPHTNLNEIAHFAKGEFTDVGFPNLKAFVPIFYLVQDKQDLKNILQIEKKIENEEEFSNIEVSEVEPQITIMPTTTGSSVIVQDREETLRDKILQVLDKNEESMAISRVAKALYKNESDRDEKNKVKLVVNKEVIKLVKEDILDKQTLVNEKGKVEKHCFRKDKNLSNFHATLQRLSVKILKNENITILSEAKQGIQGEDIELENCVIECETGLKESLGFFDRKVMEHSKKVLIVVPNMEQKERYSCLASVHSGNAKVVLLSELIQAVKEAEK